MSFDSFVRPNEGDEGTISSENGDEFKCKIIMFKYGDESGDDDRFFVQWLGESSSDYLARDYNFVSITWRKRFDFSNDEVDSFSRDGKFSVILTEYFRQSWKPSSTMTKKSAVHNTGCSCVHCHDFNSYAEPNLNDGKFLCFSCRSSEGWRYR